MNNGISIVIHWFAVHNLCPNEKKNNFVKFTLIPNIGQTVTIIIIPNEKLNLLDTVVFLGITWRFNCDETYK